MTRGRRALLYVLTRTCAREVATRCHVTVSSIYKLTSGERLPSRAVADALEREYGIHVIAWRIEARANPSTRRLN